MAQLNANGQKPGTANWARLLNYFTRWGSGNDHLPSKNSLRG